jgi:hypothetical protein
MLVNTSQRKALNPPATHRRVLRLSGDDVLHLGTACGANLCEMVKIGQEVAESCEPYPDEAPSVGRRRRICPFDRRTRLTGSRVVPLAISSRNC